MLKVLKHIAMILILYPNEVY